MTTVQNRLEAADQTVRVGQLAAVAIVTWVVFALLADLEPNGLHLLVLGGLRIVLLATLLAFAVWSGATSSRLGRVGLGLAAVTAIGSLVGGAGAVVTDGWSYNPFTDPLLAGAGPPWYAYVVGASTMLFAVGTIVVGLAGRAAGWPAVAAVAAGVGYVAAFALQASLGETTGAVVGHLIWVAAWLALALGLITSGGRRARRRTPVGGSPKRRVPSAPSLCQGVLREHPDGRPDRHRRLLQDHRAGLDDRARVPRRRRHVLHDGLHRRPQPTDPRLRRRLRRQVPRRRRCARTSPRSRPAPRSSPEC